jgi:hypothetical protein
MPPDKSPDGPTFNGLRNIGAKTEILAYPGLRSKTF